LQFIGWRDQSVRVMAVGVATLDIISELDSYPEEDDEVRAGQRRFVRGGNATNSLVVLSQLGHTCSWAGSLANDAFSKIIQDDLVNHQVDMHYVAHHPDGRSPVSCINLGLSRGSRTIVHFRDLPEYDFDAFDKIQLTDFDWLHFEGRNIDATLEMMRKLKACANTVCSVEIEKNRENIESLVGQSDIAIFSKSYAESQGYEEAENFLRDYAKQFPQQILLCAWGNKGAYAVDTDRTIIHCQAETLDVVVDTVAAGDVFNAGFIHRYYQSGALADSLYFACRLAEKKCRRIGLENLI
jgi:ketohexokinase